MYEWASEERRDKATKLIFALVEYFGDGGDKQNPFAEDLLEIHACAYRHADGNGKGELPFPGAKKVPAEVKF